MVLSEKTAELWASATSRALRWKSYPWQVTYKTQVRAQIYSVDVARVADFSLA